MMSHWTLTKTKSYYFDSYITIHLTRIKVAAWRQCVLQVAACIADYAGAWIRRGRASKMKSRVLTEV